MDTAIILTSAAAFNVVVLVGGGVILQKSIINKFNESFKNQSYEKQKRWDFKKEIYFDLLQSIATLSYEARRMSSLFVEREGIIGQGGVVKVKDQNEKDAIESDFELIKKSAKSYESELKNLYMHTATAKLIIDKKSHEELVSLINTNKNDGESFSKFYSRIGKLASTTQDNITDIAQDDLKIEVPVQLFKSK